MGISDLAELSPKRIKSVIFAGSFSTGVFSEKWWRSAKSESIHQYQLCRPTRCEANAQGRIAPSAIVRRLLGNTSSGSTSKVEPSPVHSGHAPYGLLKENVRGSISGKLIPQSVQANFSEKIISLAFSAFSFWPPASGFLAMPIAGCWMPITAVAIPFPIFNAISTESRMRGRSMSLPSANRSTTTSIECFLCLSNFLVSASSKSMISPFIRARINPPRFNSSNMPLCSPLVPRIKGASKNIS